MALQLIEDTSNSLPEVPFLSDWTKKKANDGTTFIVRSVLVSGKGCILFTSDFKVFIWKSEKLHNVLLEHVGTGLNPDLVLPSIAVVPIATTKKGFAVGFEDEVKGTWNMDGSVYSFLESLNPPSEVPTLPLSGSGMVDSSPKNGRRAS